MASKTKAETVKRALQRLNIVSASENPNAQDADLVGGIYDVLRLELQDSGIAGVEANVVPLNMFEGMAALLAGRSAGDFGLMDRAMSLEAEGWRRVNAASSIYSGHSAELNTY
ncbi:MAG: hypothetical protein ACK5QX_12205 [bacterium]